MNKKNKVVVLVGSLKFWDKIQEMHEKLELQGYAVIGITPHVMERNYTKEDYMIYDIKNKEMHYIFRGKN